MSGAGMSPGIPSVEMKCPKGHSLALTRFPRMRKKRCCLCRSAISRSTTRHCCRWCSYDICYECGMQFSCQSEVSRLEIRQSTMRTAFRSRVDSKQQGREVLPAEPAPSADTRVPGWELPVGLILCISGHRRLQPGW